MSSILLSAMLLCMSPAEQYALLAFHWGSSHQEIEDKLGKPIRTESVEIPIRNRYSHKKAELVTLDFDSLIIEYAQYTWLESAANGTPIRQYIEQLSYTDCEHVKEPHCLIGSSKSQITTKFGEPSTQTDNQLRYQIQYGDMGSAPLSFELTDNLVTRVTIRVFND